MPSYFVTAGRGTTYFVCKELREFDPCSKISTTDGKVFFTSDISPSKWLDLKSIERLFIQVYYNNGYRTEHEKDGVDCISVLQKTVENISIDIWSSALSLWKEIRSELRYLSGCEKELKRTWSPEANDDLTIFPHKKNRLSSGDGCDQNTKQVCGDVSSTDVASHLLFKKLAKGCELHDSSSVNVFDHQLPDSSESSLLNSKETANPGKSFTTVDSKKSFDKTDCAKTSNSSKVLPYIRESSSAVDVKECCKVTDLTESDKVTFRVSSKISGYARQFGKRAVLDALISAIESKGWKSSTHQPQVEVYSQLNNEHLVIGFPCTREPLSKRPYLRTIGLRSTVCWAMASLADTKETDIVLDPMCGAGTLLIEAVHSFNVQCTIGCDVSTSQLSLASESVNWANIGRSCSLLRADVRALPLSADCVDVILCDTPFGSKHGLNCEQVGDMYPSILNEMSRVLKSGGRLVLLTSAGMVTQLVKAVLDMSTIGGYTVHKTCSTNGYTISEKCPVDEDAMFGKFHVDGDPVGQDLFAGSKTADERTTGCVICNHSPIGTCVRLVSGSEDELCESKTVCGVNGNKDTRRLNEEDSVLHKIDLLETKTLVNVAHPDGVQMESIQTACYTFKELMLRIKEDQVFVYKHDSQSLFKGPLVFKRSHFLKLGETMAYALLFHKR